MKINLFGKTLSQLEAFVTEKGWPRFTARQLAQWMYKKQATNFEMMTNIPKAVRQILEEECEITLTPPTKVDASVDGTKKYLFPVGPRFVEAAYLPDRERKTLCVSSQVGCKMGCLFCMTGKQGFQANLTSGEILNQIRSLPEGQELTNLVYMGMGEPLDNLENVLDSLEVLTSDWGWGWSSQRITLSSVGLMPSLQEFIKRSKVRFALSLHTPFEDERRALMPVQMVYPLTEVLDFLRTIQDDHRRLSIEYICFEGINDTPRHGKELVKILHGLKTRVNLIHFHPIPGSPLKGSSVAAMEAFRDQLNEKGLTATIRRSRGEDIYAACGLLSTKALGKKTQEDHE